MLNLWKKKKQTKINELKKEINDFNDRKEDVNRFMDIVKKYTKIKVLDANILNEFIEKIHIHEAVYEESLRKQHIDIYYKFIGLI